MPSGRTGIRPTLTPVERVRMVPLAAEGCRALRDAGVRFLGIDLRPPQRTWGEGLSHTLLLFWVVEGQVHLEGHDLVATAGTCLVVPPTVPKRLTTTAAGTQAAWAHLEWRRPWTRVATAPQVLPGHRGQHLFHTCTAMVDEAAVSASPVLPHLTQVVLAACRDLGRATPAPPTDPWQALWDEVAAHPDRPWTAVGLARRAGLSRAQFHRRVLAHHGVTPMDRVRRLRLERAALLLQTTDQSVEAIAAQVGYSTGFALSHALVRQGGRRPRDLRSS